MVTTKQMNIKNRTYYFYDFDPKLLKLDKKSFKNISIYYIGYVTKNQDAILIVQILFIYLLMK